MQNINPLVIFLSFFVYTGNKLDNQDKRKIDIDVTGNDNVISIAVQSTYLNVAVNFLHSRIAYSSAFLIWAVWDQ